MIAYVYQFYNALHKVKCNSKCHLRLTCFSTVFLFFPSENTAALLTLTSAMAHHAHWPLMKGKTAKQVMVPTFTLPPLLFSKASTRRVMDSLPTYTSLISFQITGPAAFVLPVSFATGQVSGQKQQMKHWAIVSTESQVTTAVLLLLLDRREREKKKAETRKKHITTRPGNNCSKTYQECGLSGGQIVVYSLSGMSQERGKEWTSGSTAGGRGFAVERLGTEPV